MRNALRIGLVAAKANAVPMVALWTLSVALVVGYYLFPEVRSVLDCLGRFQRDYGIWAGFASQFVFCGVIPCVFRMSVAGPSAIAVKTSDADSDFPRWKIHDLELEVLEVA